LTGPLEHIADRRPQTRKLSGMKPPPIPGVSGEKKARGSEEHAGWLMGYIYLFKNLARADIGPRPQVMLDVWRSASIGSSRQPDARSCSTFQPVEPSRVRRSRNSSNQLTQPSRTSSRARGTNPSPRTGASVNRVESALQALRVWQTAHVGDRSNAVGIRTPSRSGPVLRSTASTVPIPRASDQCCDDSHPMTTPARQVRGCVSRSVSRRYSSFWQAGSATRTRPAACAPVM